MTDLPNDVAAEAAVLGSIMLAPRELHRVAGILRSEDFYESAHAEVFVAIQAVDSGGSLPDVVQVVAELRRRHSKVDPLAVRELLADVGAPASAAFYARIVSRTASLRRLMSAAGATIEQAAGDGDPSEIATAAIARFEVAHWRGGGEMLSAEEVVREALEEIELEGQDDHRVKTGIPRLDGVLGGGLAPGRVYVVGARPGVGKSALLGNIVLAALRASTDVLFVSLEMSGREVMGRLVTDAYDLEPTHPGEEISAMIRVADEGVWPLHFRERADLAGIVAAVKENHYGLVVIDYLQLLPTNLRFERRDLEIAHISRAIKQLAMGRRVPILAAAQLNRGSKEKNARPRLHDLRESGAQEQDADIVILLDRDAEEDSPETKLYVAKNRHGRTGSISLVFDGAHTRFRERPRYAATETEEPPPEDPRLGV